MRTSVEWRTLQIAKSFGDNNLSFQLSNLTYPPLETISPMGKFLYLPPARVVEAHSSAFSITCIYNRPNLLFYFLRSPLIHHLFELTGWG